MLGEYQLAAGNRTEARESLGRALELDAALPQAHRQLADLEFADGNFAAALDAYRSLPSGEQDSPALQDRLARCYLETGRPEGAIELLAGRQKLEPAARLVLARSQARLGRWSEALKTFQAVRVATPTAEWAYYYAAALAACGKHAEAEGLFKKLASDPGWKDRARRQLGHLRLLQGDKVKAGELYRSANGAGSFDLGRSGAH